MTTRRRSPLTLIIAGALGTSSTALAQSNPVPVQVDAGADHSCLVTSCGSVLCWGRNDSRQSDDRFPASPNIFLPAPKYTQVSVGSRHTCALNENGVISCWGRGFEGQTSVPVGFYQRVDAGGHRTCGIRTSGELACWGNTPSPPPGRYRDLSVGVNHACAVTEDGFAVRCWGLNASGQAQQVTTTDLPNPGSFFDVEVGAIHTCARTGGGRFNRLYCWGSDSYGAVTGGRAVPVVNAPHVFQHGGAGYTQLSTGRWGTMAVDETTGRKLTWGWGWPFSGASASPPSDAPKMIDAGSGHACMITEGDQLRCWGSNSWGQISQVPSLPRFCPIQFPPVPRL